MNIKVYTFNIFFVPLHCDKKQSSNIKKQRYDIQSSL